MSEVQHQDGTSWNTDSHYDSAPGPVPGAVPGSAGAPPVIPIGQLEARICELAGHLTAAMARFLLLVADFDERRGWAAWEMPSCAAWLSWKCQVAPGTAREQVRTARALATLPFIRGEFAAARLSYAKVRALTRIATPETERFARAHRRVTNAQDADVRSQRRLAWGWVDDHILSLRGMLPPEAAAVFLQALRAARDDLEHPHDDDHDHHSGDGVSAETPSGPTITHPAWPLRCHFEDGGAVSPAALRLIGCNATITAMVHGPDGGVLSAGRRARKPSAALRRAVRERDGYRCRFPGCQSRRTDAHHIRFWADGGETSLANLASLCKTHHRIVHTRNITLTAAGGGLVFRLPGGIPILPSPALPSPVGDITHWHDARLTPATIIPPHSGERLDLNMAIWVALANARVNIQRRPSDQGTHDQGTHAQAA